MSNTFLESHFQHLLARFPPLSLYFCKIVLPKLEGLSPVKKNGLLQNSLAALVIPWAFREENMPPI